MSLHLAFVLTFLNIPENVPDIPDTLSGSTRWTYNIANILRLLSYYSSVHLLEHNLHMGFATLRICWNNPYILGQPITQLLTIILLCQDGTKLLSCLLNPLSPIRSPLEWTLCIHSPPSFILHSSFQPPTLLCTLWLSFLPPPSSP